MNVPAPPPDATSTEQSEPAAVLTRGKVAIGLSLVSLVAFAVLGLNAEQLLLGWLYFPWRTVPQVTVNWPSAILGLVSALLLIPVIHHTATWLTKILRPHGRSQRWTSRCTIVAAAMLLVLFAAGTSLVGAIHQAIWTATGRSTPSDQKMSQSAFGLLTAARESDRQREAAARLKLFGLGFHNYHETMTTLPPGGTMNSHGELLHGWAIMLGSYVNWVAPDLVPGRSWREPPNDRIYKCQLSEFVNPSLAGPVFDDEGYGLAHWAGNLHVLPIRTVPTHLLGDSATTPGAAHQPGVTQPGVSLAQIADGAANTILLGSVSQNLKPWGHPANVRDPGLGVNRSPHGFGGPPNWNGALFLMCDGSVRLLSSDTDLGIMQALATPSGGEQVNLSDQP